MKRIQISQNQRFLVDEDGAPFFWLGDTAWELFHRCDRDEAAFYLENRRQKGFNVIQAVVLAELDGLHTPNPYGELPLINDDPTQPNETYFDHVDFVVNTAAKKGLYIGMLPTWGDKVNRRWGVGPVVFNIENARTYGEYIGRRYRDQPNIIWILGGDREEITDGVDFTPLWRAMAEGIRNGVDEQTLMSYHPQGERGSSLSLHYESWLDINMWQSGHRQHDAPNWEYIMHDYNLTPIKPTLDGEPCYEDHPVDAFTREWKPEYGYFNDYDVRKQAYRAVFAGACGHTYGHHSIWQMYQEAREPVNFPYCDWKTALDRPGAGQLIHLRRLMETRQPYLSRIPDQNLLASVPELPAQHIRATRDANGAYAMIYIPNASQTVEVNMSRLDAKAITAWWYDPRTGSHTIIRNVACTGTHTFTTPDHGSDWVLVFDDQVGVS